MSYLKSTRWNLSNYKILWRNKSLNLGPKTPFLVIFNQKCLILVLLGKNFQKTIVIFENSILKFVYLQNFTKKQKCVNMWQKSLIYVFLGSKFKLILSYLKLVPSNSASCKISWKNKNTYVSDQKCLIWVFLTKKCLIMVFWGNNLGKIFSCFKSAPSNLSICKI